MAGPTGIDFTRTSIGYQYYNGCTTSLCRKNGPCYDAQHRFRPVFNEAMLQFQRARNPTQFMSYDEGMAKYLGRCAIAQVLIRKPDPRGIKSDMLCDCEGFVYNALVTSPDPVPYDEDRGRIVASVNHVLSGANLDWRGKDYRNENRTVSRLSTQNWVQILCTKLLQFLRLVPVF